MAVAPGGEVNVAAASGLSGCGGKAESGWEEVCQELIEFVLPALTLGASGLSGHTAWGQTDRSAPTGASDITVTLIADVNPYTSATRTSPSIYPVWSGSKDVTLWGEVSNCYKIVFWTFYGPDSESDI